MATLVKRDWNREARRLLKQQMQAAGWGYAELSDALRLDGLNLSPKVLANKVNRGSFTLAFFLRVMALLKIGQVQLPAATVIAPGATSQRQSAEQ